MVNIEQANSARDALRKLIAETHCNPLLVRIAWHDAGSYSKDATGEWPAQGGATGSIRFQPELGYGCNNGVDSGLTLLQPIKDAHPDLSWADLIQLGGAVAIEECGGPKIPLRLGRVDATAPEHCTPDGRLPGAAPPFGDGAATPAQHLRNIFYRMGLNDKEIVALSGCHTIGRARPERSGQGKASTKYTEHGPGKPGGSSWTEHWLKFDNSYFADIKNPADPELLVLPTDACLFEDDAFKPFAELYAADQAAFFKDYAEAHAKLSELGAKWDGEPVLLA